ncbi:MAG TPA: acetyltransferase [Candidatus Binatia bacterium]|jgi:sugar O-acyltransferase (sialic acid O-acetyltransferase NeuD family)|nr:acetyltransferase [Candidatus Binatia bacterium]
MDESIIERAKPALTSGKEGKGETSVLPLLILGTRTFAVEVADLVSEIPHLRLAGFVENLERERCGETLEGVPVYWVEEMARLAGSHWAVCALSTTHRSRFTEQVAAYGLRFATAVHPSARISTKTSVGEGTIISVGAILASHTRVGRHVIINRGALIGHHTEIGDYVSIQPGANIAGACRIGEAAYVGMGATVIDHITIGAHSVIGAGAVVTTDVPDHVLVVGVPARVVKENIAGK